MTHRARLGAARVVAASALPRPAFTPQKILHSASKAELVFMRAAIRSRVRATRRTRKTFRQHRAFATALQRRCLVNLRPKTKAWRQEVRRLEKTQCRLRKWWGRRNRRLFFERWFRAPHQFASRRRPKLLGRIFSKVPYKFSAGN